MTARSCLIAILLAACSAEPASPGPDAEAPDAAPDAAPCGGACGAGTVCELGRCVAVIGPDASTDVAADAGSDATAPDAPEAPPADAPPESSVPVCPAGLVLCGRACVDTATDTANCGGCNQMCGRNPDRHLLPTCARGACVTGCEPNWGDCNADLNDGCEGSLTRVTNCGRCRVDCGRSGACVPSDGGYACR